ncbi:MAG: hypothetical protein G01um1014106_719 [Parcubacteria group bacterium Gr01-1014_106]|nr:MAG: hypothetical protein G01um1014106_719 [Parcubacteria group bacterium Gr01-1014_106]
MALRTLPHFSSILGDTFQLARARLGTLVVLATVPAVPLLLFSPFIAQALFALDQGAVTVDDVVSYISSWTSVLALIGMLLGVVVSIVSTAGMLFTLSAAHDPGPRTALQHGFQRWLPFVGTQILTTLAVFVVMLPGLLFLLWTQKLLGFSLATDIRGLSLGALLISILLLLPALLVATWYAFSLIPAARGDAWGPDALRFSHRLVHGASMHVFGLLFAWAVLEFFFSLVLNLLFPGLDLFRGFVHYYATTILGSAYLVTVYHALRKA